jgi:predicted flap endonuclease-1-like 5' DNA nuclease
MLRWLIRLLALAVIAAIAALVISRALNQEEDFDDIDEFDDLEAGLDFQETPVEIDVPAQDISEGTTATLTGSTYEEAFTEAGNQRGNGPTLTQINGIGSAYEARLQAAGINSVQDLAQADAQQLNQQLDVIGGQSTIEAWIDQAQKLAEGSQPREYGQTAQ